MGNEIFVGRPIDLTGMSLCFSYRCLAANKLRPTMISDDFMVYLLQVILFALRLHNDKRYRYPHRSILQI